jgi:hypothetical protein
MKIQKLIIFLNKNSKINNFPKIKIKNQTKPIKKTQLN